tara:strand:- start:692 stop:1396 length:705 start_codon:yes stop_codon:yes gene_type:complete
MDFKTFKQDIIELPKLKRVTQEGKRVYIREGMEAGYPSVTTITSLKSREAIRAWRERIGKKKADAITVAANRRGTSAHKLIENYIVGEDVTAEAQPLAISLFMQLKAQADKSVDNLRVIEGGLMSDYLQVAGTVDLVAEFDGKLSIIDWKTSKKPKVRSHCYQYFMQAAAYAVMFEEVTKIPVPQLVIIGSSEEGDAWQFVEKRDDWIGKFMDLRQQYATENNESVAFSLENVV